MIETVAGTGYSLDRSQVFGSYRILGALGQGGMGEVYEAEQIDSGRHVALKVMSHRLGSEIDRKRFLREGRLAASVNHPNAVYIFGSEEIEERPVIVMELVRAGTLGERVQKSGPLAVHEAVNAILQVLDGLDAAHSNGVLHRDVKPANCFVDSDGTVKIGDFGLSISTHARPESMVTTAGTLLATPSFSSPEQLRGDPLDVRSDIYSVGATLYYLLTGQTPHLGQGLVQLISQVLNEAPRPPHEVDKQVPRGLSRVVLRCLAKAPSARFADYHSLRKALHPFALRATPAATIARRSMAGLIDFVPLLALEWPIGLVTGMGMDASLAARTPVVFVWFALNIAGWILYYSLFEGLLGASPGKMLMGLRVVGPDRGLPGLGRATARAAICVFIFYLPDLLTPLFVSAAEHATNPERTANLTLPMAIVLIAAFFSTMRRRNGFAAPHDLLTGTRVVVNRLFMTARSVIRTEPEGVVSANAVAEASGQNQILGQFQVIKSLALSAEYELLLGEDQALRRRVWIVLYSTDVPPLTESRRNLNRVGRLRWLDGERGARAWDAFECPDGMPLLDFDKPQAWSVVRSWLDDLLEEIAAQQKEKRSDVLAGLDRIWIARNGRALVLDFPAPLAHASTVSTPAKPVSTSGDIADLLGDVASLALQGGAAHSRRDSSGTDPSLPVRVSKLLRSIRAAPIDRIDAILEDWRGHAGRVVTLSRRRRLASLLLAPIAFGAMVFLGSLDESSFDRKWARAHAGVPSLRRIVELHDGAGQPFQKQIEIFMFLNYREIVSEPAFWSGELGSVLSENRDLIMRTIAVSQSTNSDSTAAAIQHVRAHVEPSPVRRLIDDGVQAVLGILFVLSVPSFIAQVLFGQVLGIGMFGMAVVNRSGLPVSRIRLLYRWVVAWSPIVLCWVLYFVGRARPSPRSHTVLGDGLGPGDLVIATIVLVLIAGAIWSVLNPKRGPHDRIAGTWLVSS